MRVLMVDDEFPAFLLSDVAEGTGATIDLARTVQEGRDLFLQEPTPDLILMDGHMKGSRSDATVLLVLWMRGQNYRGPIAAISASPELQGELIKAGCTMDWDKVHASQLLKDWIVRNSVDRRI